ncbi:MAG TPA: ester cyclase [Dehalococcoidia bacterium]|nr:ester cyclase [Dehalococcoidia bacterium]
MSTQDNKAVYRRFIEEAFNKANFAVLDEVLAPNYVIRDTPPGSASGADGVRQVVTMFRSAFPDMKITIEDLVAEGDKVTARSILQGTHQGALFGIAPTGKQVAMASLTMVTVRDGKIRESWVRSDVQGLMGQLGATPPR